jgi:predicted DsbA family dithiol-disulfide isomerase
LLDAEIAMSTKYEVEGSPTVFINDVLYEGSRSPEDYKKAICEGFKESARPAECDEVLSDESDAEGSC